MTLLEHVQLTLTRLAGPLPHPAAQSIIVLGGRVGERVVLLEHNRL